MMNVLPAAARLVSSRLCPQQPRRRCNRSAAGARVGSGPLRERSRSRPHVQWLRVRSANKVRWRGLLPVPVAPSSVWKRSVSSPAPAPRAPPASAPAPPPPSAPQRQRTPARRVCTVVTWVGATVGRGGGLPRAAAPHRRAGAPGRGGDASRERRDGCRLVAGGLKRRTKLKAPLRVGLRLEQPLAPARAPCAARAARARRAQPGALGAIWRCGRGERRADVEARELRHRAQRAPRYHVHAQSCELLPRLPPRPALRVGAGRARARLR